MLASIDNPIFITTFIFTIIMLIIYVIKPKSLYDSEKKEFRQFGTSGGKTVLPLYVIGILMAIMIYVVVHFVSYHVNKSTIRNVAQFPEPEQNINQYAHQIQSIQNQIQQLLQQQFVNNTLQNSIMLDRLGTFSGRCVGSQTFVS